MAEESMFNNYYDDNDDIRVIYKIFQEIYSRAPLILKDLSCETIDIGYKEYINEPMDFKTIDEKFQKNEYVSITDVVKDIRLVFLNCYEYYGTNSDNTIKSLELEELLEYEIGCLDNEMRAFADIQLTFHLLGIEGEAKSNINCSKDCYDSKLLKSVAHCHAERLKKENDTISCSTIDDDNDDILEEVKNWKMESYFIDHFDLICSMWELPEIGNFVAMVFQKLNIDIVSQGEIEKMFLIPKESTTMSKLMTFLLTPIKKEVRFGDQMMPYKVWSKKLGKKLSEWFNVYHAEKRNRLKVMELLGIHPEFWTVIDEKNYLIENDYCELSYKVKVWLVKVLCDYITKKYTAIKDIISKCNENQCTIWMDNLETEKYYYYKSMPDLRVYYCQNSDLKPNIDVLIQSNAGVTSAFCSDLQLKQDVNYFKIIANSVQSLRSFLDGVYTEDTSVPDTLISALKKFIKEIEPEERNLIVLNNNTKIKLFKDWKSYSEGHWNEEEEEALYWEEKESKPKYEVFKKEIILEEGRISVESHNGANCISDAGAHNISTDNIKTEIYESYADNSNLEGEWGPDNITIINDFKIEMNEFLMGDNDNWGAINENENSATKQGNTFVKESKFLANVNNKYNCTELQKGTLLVNNLNETNNINDVSSVDVLLIKKEEEDKETLSSNSQNYINENDEIEVSNAVLFMIKSENQEEYNELLSSNKQKYNIDRSIEIDELVPKKKQFYFTGEETVIEGVYDRQYSDDLCNMTYSPSCRQDDSVESDQNENDEDNISDNDNSFDHLEYCKKKTQPLPKITNSNYIKRNKKSLKVIKTKRSPKNVKSKNTKNRREIKDRRGRKKPHINDNAEEYEKILSRLPRKKRKIYKRKRKIKNPDPKETVIKNVNDRQYRGKSCNTTYISSCSYDKYIESINSNENGNNEDFTNSSDDEDNLPCFLKNAQPPKVHTFSILRNTSTAPQNCINRNIQISNTNHVENQQSPTKTNIPIHSPDIATGENVNVNDFELIAEEQPLYFIVVNGDDSEITWDITCMPNKVVIAEKKISQIPTTMNTNDNQQN